MKNVILLMQAVLFSVCAAISQTPQSIPYQAVARDSFGTPLPNQHIQLRMSIHTGSAGGTVVYQEIDTTTTSKLGMFTVKVGSGTVVSGTFSAIDWGSGSKYLQVEVDPTGGTGYIDMGASQLLSVPYALHAGSSSVSNVAAKHIPYGGSSGLATDANFTRDGSNGNTLIKTVKNGSYYTLSLGDSTMLDVGLGSVINVPSAALSYGDTSGDFSMNIGVGKIPGYGITQFGFLNLAKSDGTFAGLDFVETDGQPALVAGVVQGGFINDGGSRVSLSLDKASLTYSSNGSTNRHGISADSTSLKIYSSITDTHSWTWPNTEGSNGQVLTTNGSGDMSWASMGGYALQVSSAAFNPADTTTYYFGERGHLPPSTVSGTRAVVVPHSGKLKAAYIHIHIDSTFSSNSNTSVYVNINGTDYAISTTAVLNTYRVDISNTAMSVDVSAGNDLQIKVVTPMWTINPSNVSFTGSLYIE